MIQRADEHMRTSEAMRERRFTEKQAHAGKRGDLSWAVVGEAPLIEVGASAGGPGVGWAGNSDFGD